MASKSRSSTVKQADYGFYPGRKLATFPVQEMTLLAKVSRDLAGAIPHDRHGSRTQEPAIDACPRRQGDE